MRSKNRMGLSHKESVDSPQEVPEEALRNLGKTMQSGQNWLKKRSNLGSLNEMQALESE